MYHINSHIYKYEHRLNVHFIMLFCALFFSLVSIAQDYTRVDAIIELYPETVSSPQVLSSFITRDFKTDEHKVRAIYTWLIRNVAYDPSAYKLFDYNFKNYAERNIKEERTRKKIINYTLNTGKAVCEGYAMTFEKLLEMQGVSNYLVHGDTKSNFKDINREFALNHVWNIAYIDNEPYLFDATWGAGRYAEIFIKEPSYYYFKTAPSHLIKSHFPQQVEDTLLEENYTASQFSQMPLVLDKQMTMDTLITPKNGVLLESDYNGVIQVQVLKAVDDISYTFGGDKKIIAPETIVRLENETHFSIPLEIGVKQILIYFEDRPALGYIIK